MPTIVIEAIASFLAGFVVSILVWAAVDVLMGELATFDKVKEYLSGGLIALFLLDFVLVLSDYLGYPLIVDRIEMELSFPARTLWSLASYLGSYLVYTRLFLGRDR